MSVSLGDLNDAVVASLRETGKLGQITAQIRAEIYRILTEDQQNHNQIPLCKENFIINELIREYMQFNGYSNSLSVFLHETGQPIDPMNREFLAHSLEIIPNKSVPLLYSLADPNSRKGSNISQETPDSEPSSPEKQKINAKPLYYDDSDNEGFFEIKSSK
ncbi:hypothetical protein TVAG_197260 [Trichomonas vaginalis G3]|uniref:FGFR1 oncogene partner (FOP) N-terminal dimerisation domain-containing protein n=1 Tax=Trichomonas vaginalis (strain ATCC PRA-98 / G3) TaxID=412133 RepID=A2EPJ6_TRIV3|nr:microtubule anchoring [Trichomonas vaginalis G3]EAY05425.1 hypothetical protein TVAG_197260 [Trichomonas vaginalis G3]KAI5523863.1 microtubule anchoring [Trichomonas vaginalis G3]|eukprot:XP_001317648.1 hypothetical protein [Trichomonas vaginalis G3]